MQEFKDAFGRNYRLASEKFQTAIDEIHILLVKDPGDDSHSKEEIEKFYEKKVEDLYGRPEYKLVFDWMDEIPPDENGKMRCFICKL